MANPYLTSAEIALMRSDFNQLLSSSEAQVITIQYRTWATPGQSPIINPVYEQDERSVDPFPVTVVGVRSIQVIIKKDWQLKKYPQFLVEVGDCIFYFSDSQNLEEPVAATPVVPNTLIFIDNSGVKWKPRQQAAGPVAKNVFVRVGSLPFSQPVACIIEK